MIVIQCIVFHTQAISWFFVYCRIDVRISSRWRQHRISKKLPFCLLKMCFFRFLKTPGYTQAISDLVLTEHTRTDLYVCGSSKLNYNLTTTSASSPYSLSKLLNYNSLTTTRIRTVLNGTAPGVNHHKLN